MEYIKMDVGDIAQIAVMALRSTNDVHKMLGVDGEEKVQKNQFGDIALRMDIAAEYAVIETFREHRIPVRILSEEHGTVELSKSPQFFGVLDGLDGSSVYASKRRVGRYGTMLAVFSNDDPTYDDYLFCGIMLHSPQPALLFCTKGNGSVLATSNGNQDIHCAQTTMLRDASLIYVDEYFAINRELFSNNLADFPLACMHSSAVHYADVAWGKADLALECTRKQNLEIAVAFGLLKEAGGVITTLDCISLEKMSLRLFGQDQHVPVVAAASLELARDVIQYIESKRGRLI